MTPNEYQREAARTECDQRASLGRMMNATVYDKTTGWLDLANGVRIRPDDEDLIPIRVNHSVLGMLDELGEIGTLYQKWIYYGKQIPFEELRQRFADEYGDVCWHLVEGLNALGLKLEDVLAANIAKLKARYPDAGWSQEKAQEENRDRAAEAAAQSEANEWKAEWEKLVKFKEYVHKRLDEAGVPERVPGPSLDRGCRIAGRLDWVLSRMKTPDTAERLADEITNPYLS